jgi:nitrogen fixation NifU-like protein
MEDWLYTDIVKDHFVNPRNVLLGVENSWPCDGRGKTGSPACGDEMLVLIRVKNDVISDIRWKTYGCASAIASTSIISEAVKGLSLKEAYKIKPADIAKRLGGLPDNKIHCSVLGDEAIRTAIDDYLVKQGREPWGSHKKVEEVNPIVICSCKNVTDIDIEMAYDEGIDNWDSLQQFTGIGTVCGKCKDKALAKIEEIRVSHGQ